MGEKMLMLNRTKRAALAAVIGFTLCITSANTVAQETIIRCSASDGHAYLLEGGLFEGDNAGWHEDREDPLQKMELKVLRDGSYDIHYSDPTTGLNSVQQSGADVVAVFVTEDTIVLVARYPFSVETYLFSLKNREVIWTDVKGFGIAKLGRIMRAPCD